MSKEVVKVNTSDVKQSIEQAFWYLSRRQPFFAAMLQEINLKVTREIPTAAVGFDPKFRKYSLIINPEFFTNLKLEERMAILKHEVLHLSHGHLFRFADTPVRERLVANIAMDLAINQMVPEQKADKETTPAIELPKGCIDIKEFFYKDNANKKTAFPTFRTAEEYFKLLKENMEKNEEQMNAYGKGKTAIDQHHFDQLSEEDKKKMMEELKEVVQRTIEKTSYGKSNLPSHINDLIKELEAGIAKLNYKQILRQCIKKSLSISDRNNTYKRPSKRYGVYAPGTENGKVPNINFYQDTSGSMSYKEMCEFFNVIDQFTKVGAKRITLSFWHTVLYKTKKYRNVKDIRQDDIESGGTDVSQVLHHIKKTKPDLAVILTDGEYYSDNIKVDGVEILWVISKNSSTDHPLKKTHGKTIGLQGVLE